MAMSLQQKHSNITLIDGDLEFGDILVHLNIRPTITIADLIRDDEVDQDLILQVLSDHNSGLKVLLAPPKPELAEMITPDLITTIIKALRTNSQAVIIDTGHILNDSTLSLLEQATYILIITTPDLPSVKSTKLFLDIGDQLAFASDRITLVVNQADLPYGLSAQQIKNVLKHPTLHEIPHDPKFHLALNRGLSIVQHDATSSSANAITALAQTVWETVQS